MDKKEQIKKYIIEIMEENDLQDAESIKINYNSSLTNDLGMDSLNLAQLTVMIESQFGVDIFEKKIVRTFGEIIEMLECVILIKSFKTILSASV